MRISFDLDETLISSRWAGDCERGTLPRFVLRFIAEPLRRGAKKLFRELECRGHSVWIYTTSSRSSFRIRRWLLLYGLSVGGIVNDERHRRMMVPLQFSGRAPTKFPPAFEIDLHVDDLAGVGIEGDRYGFEVLVLDADDEDWTDAVLHKVESLTAQRKQSA